MPGQNSKPARSLTRSLCRVLLLWILLPLLVLAAAGVTSIYLLCRYQPDLVAGTVQQYLNATTGLPWRIRGGIRPMLTPLPGFMASDVRLLAASEEQSLVSDPVRPLMQVEHLRLYIDPADLWSWPPRLEAIELDHPTINLVYDRQSRPLWLPPDAPPQTPPPEPDPPPDAARDNLKMAADLVCTLPPLAMQPVTIKDGRLMSYSADGSLLLSFSGFDGTFFPDQDGNHLRLSSSFAVPDADLDIHFDIAARVGCEGIPAIGSISGQIHMTPPGSRTLSGTFASGFQWHANGKDILLPDFRVLAETDALTADLVMDLAKAACTGKVFIHKLSLPRWFQFGRVLPPGLRQTLDALVGDFDLVLDTTKAEARNLRGVAGSLAVSGYVGTPDFSAPVVVVDLDVDRANLDLLFPFLAAVGRFVPDPVPPVFDHPPLAPYPQDLSLPPLPSGNEDEIDVGYDVTVRVARPRVHDVDAGPLEVLVFPQIVQDKDKTRVSFNVGSILDGRVDGILDIDEHSILMHYDAKDLELRLLPENLDNQVKIAGKITGVCDIDVPMLENSDLADNWKLKVDASISGCEITGHYAKAPWRLFAGTAKAVGTGNIFAVPTKGIRIEGVWNLAAQGIKTSWYPKGKDSISGVFDGGLHWPPFGDDSRPPRKTLKTVQRRGVEKISGKLNLKGSLIVPIATLRVPVTGNLRTGIDWRLYDETIALNGMEFEGFGSYNEGAMLIDFSGREVIVKSENSFKLNPRVLLKSWDLLPPSGVRPPELLTGRTEIHGDSHSLAFRKIKAELEGAPITGEISWKEADAPAKNEPGLWTIRLNAGHLNLDNIFPPKKPDASAVPDATPWNLSPLQNLSLDAQFTLQNLKWDKLTSSRTKITAALQNGRFSVHGESADFYSGKSTVLLQGAILPQASQVLLRKGLAQIQGANLARLLYDYSKDTSYGGTADFVVDLAGTLSSDADIPGKLSGAWSLDIKDGMYPAFMSSQGSTLRNTFSKASASGALEKGVIRSNNFVLSGPMVEMSGGGWLNLNTKTYDIEVSATFAKVPTVPVKFYGSFNEPRMRVRGVDMVLETVQAAGSTIFGLLKGVLELPGHAVRGIGTLFDTKETNQPPAVLAPVRESTNRPGQ